MEPAADVNTPVACRHDCGAGRPGSPAPAQGAPLDPVGLGLAGVLVLGVALGLLIAATDVVEAADQAVLSWFADLRAPALTGPARLADRLTSFH
jgi:hypothetical protein